MIKRFIKELRRRKVFGVIVIYVAASWVLLQVVDVMQGVFPVDPRLAFLAVIVGFPIAVIAGWLYDITKQGVFRTPAVSADESFDPALKGRDFALLFFLAIVWGAAVYIVYAPPATDKSIAVLPFENRSHDPDSEIFAFGVRDDLNIHLSRIGALRVIASNSVDKVDLSWPADRIGAQLGVAYLLKGSVDRIADRICVNITLIASAENTQSWGGSFDRELSTESLFDIRSSIAEVITSELRAQLTESEQRAVDDRPTENLAALQAFQLGRFLLAQRTPDAIESARREFEKAISLDPEFAQAHAELAISIFLLGAEYGDLTAEETLSGAGPHVERALALDPRLAEAHAANGWISWKQHDVDGAVSHFKRATELNPNYADGYIWMANVFGFELDRPKEYFVTLEKALSLNPLSVNGNYGYIDALIERNRIADAERQLEKFESISPETAKAVRVDLSIIGGFWANGVLAHLEEAKDNSADADLAHDLVVIGLPEEARLLTNIEDPYLLMWLGRTDTAINNAETEISNSGNSPEVQQQLGIVLAGAGHYDRARPHLEEAWRLYQGRFATTWHLESVLAEALVAVRRDIGDDAGADEVLRNLTDNVGRLRDSGVSLTQTHRSVDYKEGIAKYLKGERDRGLALISKAVEDGYSILPPVAFQKAMYEDPGFSPILEKHKEHQERERRKVLDVVCNDNPYAALWQPMEETCNEHFRSSANRIP